MMSVMDVLIYTIVSLTILVLIMMLTLGYYEDRRNRLLFFLIGILACWLFYAYSTLLRSTYMDHGELVDVVASYIF